MVRMNDPAGMCPGAGIRAGGRRLAVGSPHGGPGGDGVPAGVAAAPLCNAGSELLNARSDTEPQAASADTAQTATAVSARRVIGTPAVAAAARRGPGRRSRAQAPGSATTA